MENGVSARCVPSVIDLDLLDHCSVPGERAACELFANTACHDVTRTARRKSVIDLDLLDGQAGLRDGVRPDGTQHGCGRACLDQLTA